MNRVKLRKLFINITMPITFARFASEAIGIANQESYYPELERKSKFARIRENLYWLAKYKEPNTFYNLYGFDIKNYRIQSEYLDNYSFYLSRGDNNKIHNPESQICLLRDKLLFYEFLKFNNFNTPEVIALIKNKKVYDITHNFIGDIALKYLKDYFIKERKGECASFVRHIKDYKEFEEVKNELVGSYIVQKRISQTEATSLINSKSINTLRIVTIKKGDNYSIFSSLLRVGTNKSNYVDNWAAGGVAIGINDDGSLKEYGFYKPQYGTKISKHPDSDITFKDYKINHYDSIKNKALELHKCFDNVHSIGWDIAITESGPCFIEGNDNWEISLMQACNEPLKKKWKELL